jgi:arginyl-tRNA synthetase
MLFDPNESIQLQGFTGPFIQYTHARIRSIIRKAESMNVSITEMELRNVTSLEKSELEAVQVLSRYESKVKEAAKDYSPAIIANYVYELAKEYNQFYQSVPIFNESDPAKLKFRIAFSKAVADTINRGMALLGINVPERM